ncbi:MAG: replication-relaxation family protein [Oscillospiraceae bacterium]|nr:replication-relaxation family protein [Oscillospiraceae bacterium]
MALNHIYAFRCLSEDLLHRYVYKHTNENDTLNEIRRLVDRNLIDIMELNNDFCVFCLTTAGIRIVRELSPEPLYRLNKRTGERIYEVEAKELRPIRAMIKHQLCLNELSLMIQERCSIPLSCYKDSKFLQHFTYVQPDGAFDLMGYSVFLETDMDHEAGTELVWKWNHYRNYFSSTDYYLRRNKPVVVLFALENISRVELRRKTVVRTLMKTAFDLIGSNFDCYIGSSRQVTEIFANLYYGIQPDFSAVMKEHGYQCPVMQSEGEPRYYQNRNRGIYIHSYEDRSIRKLKYALTFQQYSRQLPGEKRAPLLLVCNNEREIFKDLSSCEMMCPENVFFTTRKRLQTSPLHRAVFQFDELNNRVHFADEAWTKRIHEKKER